jgi:hypothetical protein
VLFQAASAQIQRAIEDIQKVRIGIKLVVIDGDVRLYERQHAIYRPLVERLIRKLYL